MKPNRKLFFKKIKTGAFLVFDLIFIFIEMKSLSFLLCFVLMETQFELNVFFIYCTTAQLPELKH